MAAILTIAGKEIPIQAGDMSVMDAITIEEEYGKTIDDWYVDVNAKKIRAAAVGVLVLARRTDASITMDDVLELPLMKVFAALNEGNKKPVKGGVTVKSPTKTESDQPSTK